ncbi:unnamed protein product [Effrenium voratum]|uniref:Carrier domain-containing protein n=1 Tax=Effrenium voratum TaxID=2562239 RepID=A0AA36MKE7_9DINO|nr:unnamed protein product [Effrenium voratum]
MLAGEDFRGDTAGAPKLCERAIFRVPCRQNNPCRQSELAAACACTRGFAQSSPPADHSNIAVHTRLVGHSRAITSVFFNLLEDQLVTTSIDKSVRFWNVDTGEMLKVFTDSSPVPVAAFLPFNPQVFVAANSNAVLRLVNVQNGMVLQKLKVETEVRTLKFDDTGLFLLAGTKSGSIHVLEATDNNSLKFKFKVQLARAPVGSSCFRLRPKAGSAMEGEELQRRRLDEDSKKLLETEAANLASYYSQLAEDKNVSPKVREAAMLYSVAEEHLQDDEVEEALSKAGQALELFREAGNKAGQQDSVRLLCAAERLKQSPDFSIDKVQAELRSFRESDDKRGQGCMLLALAETQLVKALAGEALSNIEEALPLLRQAGDKRLEAFGAVLAARAQLRRCQAKDAVLSAENAVSLYKEAGDRIGEGKSYNWLALAQMDAGRPAEALSAAHMALEIAQDLDSHKLQAGALQLLAKVHVFKEKSRAAVQFAERALAVSRKVQRSKAEGGALRLLVNSLVQRGDLKRALKEAEGAVEDYEASGHKRAEAAAHGALSMVRLARNELDLAASEQNQELDLLKELNDKHGQLEAMLSLSSIFASMKKPGQAKEKAEEAKQMADDIQDKKAEVLATVALATAQIAEQKHEDAANTAQEALRAAKETEDRHLEATALTAISNVYCAKSEFASGVAKLLDAKALLLEAQDKRGAAAALLSLAEAHVAAKAPEESIACAEEAKDLCREVDYKRGYADALQKLAAAHLANGNEKEAIKQALVARKYCKAIEDVRGETALLHLLASSSLQRGDKKGQDLQKMDPKKQMESGPGIEANRQLRNSAHEAVKRCRSAIALAKRNDDPHAEASAMAHLAHALAILNRGQEGLATCKRAEDLFRECGAVGQQASAACLSAEIANLMGNKGKAMELANRALELARRAEDTEVEGRVGGVMELIKGVQKQQVVQEVYDDSMPAAGPMAASAAGPAVPKGLDPDMVQTKLMSVVEQVAGGDDEVHLDTPLMESGLDSLSAVAFRNELSKTFQGIGALPAALMFDYPSVNTSDSSASIIDCTYGPQPGVLTNLAVRHRVRIAHALLPLKCCYSPSGQGYLISASEDKEVYIYNLGKGTNYKMSYLKHHQVPVVAVATNHQDTLLASADSLGRVVLWRRIGMGNELGREISRLRKPKQRSMRRTLRCAGWISPTSRIRSSCPAALCVWRLWGCRSWVGAILGLQMARQNS